MNKEKRKRDKHKNAGATRVDKKPFGAMGVVCFSVCRFIFLSVAFLGGIWCFQRFEPLLKIQNMVNRPIVNINIEGEFKNVRRDQIQQLVNEYGVHSFLELNINSLQESIEIHPWVDRVSVRRQWPDTLAIQIREQQAIARWGENYFLNVRGDVILSQKYTDLKHLPLLKGPDRYAKEILQQYLIFAKLLLPHEMTPQEIVLSDTLSWSVTVPKNIVVRLGRKDVLEKMQKLTQVINQFSSVTLNNVKAIDMRYENGFAVRWKDQLLKTVSSLSVGKNELQHSFETVQKNRKRGG